MEKLQLPSVRPPTPTLSSHEPSSRSQPLGPESRRHQLNDQGVSSILQTLGLRRRNPDLLPLLSHQTAAEGAGQVRNRDVFTVKRNLAHLRALLSPWHPKALPRLYKEMETAACRGVSPCAVETFRGSAPLVSSKYTSSKLFFLRHICSGISELVSIPSGRAGVKDKRTSGLDPICQICK